MTDTDRARYIRRLRFPQELELAFQQEYYQRFLPALRLTLLLLAVVVFVIWWRIPAIIDKVEGGDSVQTFYSYKAVIYISFTPVVLILFFFLTKLPGAWRLWQAVVTLALLVLLGIVVPAVSDILALRGEKVVALFQNVGNSEAAVRQIRMGEEGTRFFLILRSVPAVMIGLSAFRLQVRWALVGLTMIAVIVIAAVLTRLHLSIFPSVPGMVLQASLVPLTLLTMLSLVQERLARETFLANHLLEIERAKSDSLLHSILPGVIVERLKQNTSTIADRLPMATVLFADIVNFTPLAATLSAEDVVALLNEIFSDFDVLAQKYGLEKIKTMGDAYMAVAGAPAPRESHAQDAARMALEMRASIARFSRDNGESIQLRIGLNSGPVVAGVIGMNKFSYDLWGDTVNTASRMESHGTPGQIQVTEATQNLLKADFAFDEPHTVTIKGKGSMAVYTLTGPLSSQVQ